VPLISGFGLAGNIASMLVLRSVKLDMKVTFRHVLMMLSLFDSMFVLFTTISFSLKQISSTWERDYQGIVFPWIFPFIQISLTGSIWSTVSVALERYISVVHTRTWISSLSSRVYIIPVISLAITWNIPRFMELHTCYMRIDGQDDLNSSVYNLSMLEPPAPIFQDYYEENLTTGPSLCPTPLRRSKEYVRYYILLANFFTMGLLPFVILAVTNFLLYSFISKASLVMSRATARQKRDQSIAMMLVLIVVVFGCCNSIRIILNLYEVLQAVMISIGGPELEDWPEWCEALALVSHLLLVLNSSTNILIYCWKDNKFRTELLHTIGIKSLSSTQSLLMTTMTTMTVPSARSPKATDV